MSEGVNNVQLLGNLGADPELKMTQGGTAVLKLRLATAERYQDKGGVWQDRTEWHSCTVWGKRAEALHTFLAKGMQVYIEGSLHTSSYDKDGTKVYRTEVNARKVVLCGGRSEGGERRQAAPRQAAADDSPPDAEVRMPMIHLMFNNLKIWLLGTHHGVSNQHLQAYLNEFVFRFNRRWWPMTAFHAALGIGTTAHAPTYEMLYSGGYEHPNPA